MKAISISKHSLDQATLNRRFVRLFYETAVNISHDDPDLIALREARRDHAYLKMGHLLDKMMSDYEKQNNEPLEECKHES
jgi:hypothetical protein